MQTQIPPTLEMIKALIATPSISSVNPSLDQSNHPVIEILANWCEGLGFRCYIQPLPHNPDKFNLIATLGEGEQGLILAGHSDTVPYDLNRWQYDPFKAEQHEGKIYGLGTSDMKSFFALALTAVQAFNPQQFQQPLTLIATADEESGMYGARTLPQDLPARHVIIGEPTNLQPIRLHKGILMETVRLYGSSGHSSNPRLGNNALEGMYLVIQELLTWRHQLQTDYHNPAFQVPVPTLNLGYINGGDNPNRICATCELHFDLRPLPSMDITQLHQTLQQKISAKLADTGLEIEILPLCEPIPPVETPIEADIIQFCEKLTNTPAQAVSFATEAPFFNQLGMQTVVLGAGDIAQAHQPDEFIAIERLEPMIEILRQLIQHFCVQKHH